MICEFKTSIDFNKLIKELREYELSGDLNDARVRIEEDLAKAVDDVQQKPFLESPHGTAYKPILDEALTELHVIAASTYDRLGEYNIAAEFVIKWASEVQLQVLELSKSWNEAVSSPHRRGTVGDSEIPHILQQIAEAQSVWYVRILFLQQCGIAMYRISKFDMARGYLKDALFLSEILLDDLRRQAHPHDAKSKRSLEELITAYSNTCYWLGCVETYANEFQEAEEYFTNGLKAIADHLEDANKEGNEQPKPDRVRCNRATGRLLLGLGLLRFHKGALVQARSDLLSAKVLFSSEPGEIIRRLRADLLRLSVDRMEFSDNKKKLLDILQNLRALQKKFGARPFGPRACVTKHDRYYSRTMWTIGLVELDLADLYWRPGDAPKPETEKERTALLQDALGIAESQSSRVHGSQSDQLQFDILRIKTLRRLQQFEKAIDWGTVLINRPETHNHPLLRTEILISTGHAFFNLWQVENKKEFLLRAQSLIAEAAETSLKNPRAQAVCKLHLARIASALGQSSLAEKEFERWTYIARVIDKVKWIELFSKRVREELDSGAGDAFVVKMSEMPETEAYDEIMHRLKRFLLERVAAGSKREAAAYMLGLSRQTLHSWAKELGDGTGLSRRKRVRTKPAS